MAFKYKEMILVICLNSVRLFLMILFSFYYCTLRRMGTHWRRLKQEYG